VKPSKLIPVEGVPGTGNTVVASTVHQWLDRNSTPNRLYREGNLDHPADYESVAYEPVRPNDWPTDGWRGIGYSSGTRFILTFEGDAITVQEFGVVGSSTHSGVAQ
jgi:hypothetical protein